MPSLGTDRAWRAFFSLIVSWKVSISSKVSFSKQGDGNSAIIDHPAVTKLYPPKNNSELRKLFTTIVDADIPEQQKQALLYYILRDCKPLPEHAETFARNVNLPRKYKTFVSGLYNLDHGQTEHALELLTDPSLNQTFSDQILYTVLQNPKVEKSLALTYNATVCPPLDDRKTLDAYFGLLCETNIPFAYIFCQSRATLQRKELFENLVIAVLSSGRNQAASRAESLIQLPFNDEEIQWFEDCLLRGNAQSCHGAKDTVTIRRIATGKASVDIPALQRLEMKR
jgi:hypothetical protein